MPRTFESQRHHFSPDTEDDDLEAVEIFTTLDAEDQDIAALTKMCQYMSASAWDNYIVSVTTKIPDAKGCVEKQKEGVQSVDHQNEILEAFNATNIETADDGAMWTDIKSRLRRSWPYQKMTNTCVIPLRMPLSIVGICFNTSSRRG